MTGMLLVPSELAASCKERYGRRVSLRRVDAQCMAGRAPGSTTRRWSRLRKKREWFAILSSSSLSSMASTLLRVYSYSAHRAARLSAAPALTHLKRTWLTSKKHLHTLNPLPYDVDAGLGDFLTPRALRMVAVDYQQGLLDRLDEQVKGALYHKPLAPRVSDANLQRLECRYSAGT